MLWLYIVLISQFALFCYNPRHQLPKPADEQAGRNFLSLVASVDGPVYIPHHGYLATMAEKKTFAQHSAIWDVLRGKKKTEAKAILAESLDQAIREQTFSMLILDSSWHYLSNLEQFYEQTGTVISDPKSDVFFPVTGFRIRPSSIWTPKHVMGNAKTE